MMRNSLWKLSKVVDIVGGALWLFASKVEMAYQLEIERNSLECFSFIKWCGPLCFVFGAGANVVSCIEYKNRVIASFTKRWSNLICDKNAPIWQLMVICMYSFRNDLSHFQDTYIWQTYSVLVLLWNSFHRDQACEKKKRLYSYAMHSNTVFETLLRCTVHFVPMRCWSYWRECVRGLVICVHDFEYDEILLTLRSVSTTLCRF